MAGLLVEWERAETASLLGKQLSRSQTPFMTAGASFRSWACRTVNSKNQASSAERQLSKWFLLILACLGSSFCTFRGRIGLLGSNFCTFGGCTGLDFPGFERRPAGISGTILCRRQHRDHSFCLLPLHWIYRSFFTRSEKVMQVHRCYHCIHRERRAAIRSITVDASSLHVCHDFTC